MAAHRKQHVSPQVDAKAQIIEGIRQGLTVAAACKAAHRSVKSYEAYMANDPEFRSTVGQIRALLNRIDVRKSTGTFETFCENYLGQRVFWHQQQWIDLIEGRPPRDLHPAETFVKGRRELLLVNTPPEHAKSTTITANYVTYRICADPNVRIIIVSKTKEMAKKFVYQIKNRMTHPRYMKLQMDFAPPGGFQASSDAWTADMIYLGSENRDSGEKDPTLLALGIGGQIYGARADLIIVDDAVTLSNANEYEKQIDWLTQEVLTRLSDTGKLMVVGTRVNSVDLYSEILEPGRWPDGKCEWTYMCQPAVLEFHDDPKRWKTLWPQTNDRDGNLVPKWDGPALFRRRGVLQPRTWSLVYQQQQVQEDATFPSADVRATVNAMRMSGPIPKGATNCRPEGMEGLYVIAGMDPAASGHTAMVVYAVDRSTRKRYVLEVVNQAGMTPTAMRQQIKRITERYNVHEWRIEKNAFQTMLTQDAEIREFLASRGSLLKEHITSGSNKWDADFGVASMALLFDGAQEGRALIELPSSQHSEGVKALVEQLITWFPETKNKTDCVMALWFPLDVATPLWTPTGWKTMGTVEVGDQVATASGDLAKVVALTEPQVAPVFRVGLSDGSSLRATAEHRWWATPVDRGSKRLDARWMSTAEIDQTLRDSTFKRVMLANPEPVEMPEQDLPVDPYVLGAWLGDGDARQGTVFCDEKDEPAMRAAFELAGVPTTDQKRETCFGTLGLRTQLGAAGVLANKHVPEAFLRGSVKQRLGLLQGLMDTDGTVLPGRSRCYFSNTNKQLVDSVAFLALSLGFRVNVQEYPGCDFTDKGNLKPGPRKPNWRVLFTADAQTLNPFRMPRKADRVAAFQNDRRPRRFLTVKGIEPDGEALTRCITVDHPSHVFLAGRSLVPTGNCEIRAREICERTQVKYFGDSAYLTPWQREKRMVVNIDDFLAQKHASFL